MVTTPSMEQPDRLKSPRAWPTRLRSGAARLWVALLLLVAGPVWAATIEATLDRNPVSLSESFTLTFSADDNPDDDPDFSPLEEDFEILGQSSSSSVSIVNGRASKTLRWQLTLMARRAGTLTIPAIAFGSDRSNSLTVSVTQGAARSGSDGGVALFLEAEAEPKNPYVQAQAILTVRVLSRIPLGNGNLGEPEGEDVLIQRLGDDRSYYTTRDGVQYKVIERRYALFPQKSGHLRIEPVRLEAQVPRGGRALFGIFSQPSQTQRAFSEPVELDVRPIPAEFAGRHWLPAESVVLEDSWAQGAPQTASGEPVTRTLTAKATGATVGLLPELNPEAPANARTDIRQYPDQPVLNEDKRFDGVVSSRQEKTALIVSQPGSYRLPAIEVPWWNTQADRMEVARLPERILTVLPSAHPPQQDAAKAAPRTQGTPAETASPESDLPESAARPGTFDNWFWVALFCLTGWAATVGAWWFSRRRRPAAGEIPRASAQPTPSGGSMIRAVERACMANDPGAARQALLAWAGHRWPESSGISLEELERRCGGELGREINRLSRSLYGHGAETWTGAPLAEAFRDSAEPASPQRGRAGPELESLYKL